MHSLWQDLRFATRLLKARPGFTLVALLTLALGIGANTAIFSVIHAVLLAPLPYPDPDRLVMVWETNRELARFHDKPAPGNFLDLQQAGAFQSIAASYEVSQTLQGEGDAEQVSALRATPEFFATLQSKAALGRVFLPGDTQTVVLSDPLWRRRFGADRSVVGRNILINGQSWQVLGVMPAGFAMPHARIDVWLPWDMRESYSPPRFPAGSPRDFRFLSVLARLKPGITRAQAEKQIETLAASMADRYPKTNRGWSMALTSYYDEVVGSSRGLLLALFGAVGMVLLIACANVSSMLTARAAVRRHEFAVRIAIGAPRFRLVRQLLTESVVLAAIGGTCGLAIAYSGLQSLVALAPAGLPRIEQTAVDPYVLGFTLLVTLAAGVGFGLAPALQASTAGWKARGSYRRFLNTMVVAEIALALALLTGAGLFGRSFLRQLQVDPGFNPDKLLTLHVTLDGAAYRGRAVEYYRQVMRRLGALPGVVSAAAVTTLPMSGVGVDFDRPYWRAGEPEPGGEADKVSIRMATPGYFQTMGMTLESGRQFTDQDREDTTAVLIVNESMARKVWPNQSPIGKQLMLDYNRGKYAYTVVGVTRGIRYYGLKRQPEPEAFIPHAQNGYLPMNIVIRAAADPGNLNEAVKRELHAVDPAQPGHHFATMQQLMAHSIAADRFSTCLLGVLSAAALFLAALGTYSTMAFAVEERVREIGIRLALGAQRRDVWRLVLGQGMLLAAAGVTIGLAAALALTRSMQSLLFGVSATDLGTFVTVAAVLAAVALLACWLPARRATRIDPLVSIRHD